MQDTVQNYKKKYFMGQYFVTGYAIQKKKNYNKIQWIIRTNT